MLDEEGTPLYPEAITDLKDAVEAADKLEAENRDAYLGRFDGGAFSSGSHYVFGTILVRTSCELKAPEQKDFTRKIVYALSDAAEE